MTSAAGTVPSVGGTGRSLHRILVPLPFALLGVGTALALVTPGQSTAERLGTTALAAVTAAWVLVINALRLRPWPLWLGRTAPMLVCVAVQLALAGVLMARQPTFLVFGVIGFLQAYDLLPPFWAVADIAATSVLINLTVGGVPADGESLMLTLTVVGLQTCLIAWFGYLGHRHGEQSEQRRKAVAQLEAALAENAGLHAQLVAQAREAGVHDERQRLAREIHDTLAQGLTGIITQLQAADLVREHPELWQRRVDQVNALARDSLAAARRSVAALGPPELDDSRLPDAIAELAARWSRSTAVPVRVETTGEPRPVLPEIEVTLFRVAQESLANVARHARASKVAVTLSYLDDVVMLDVRDDGVGFAADAVPGHSTAADGGGFGLRAIRQRLERVHGTLAIESGPGEGTAVNASVPALAAETGGP